MAESQNSASTSSEGSTSGLTLVEEPLLKLEVSDSHAVEIPHRISEERLGVELLHAAEAERLDFEKLLQEVKLPAFNWRVLIRVTSFPEHYRQGQRSERKHKKYSHQSCDIR